MISESERIFLHEYEYIVVPREHSHSRATLLIRVHQHIYTPLLPHQPKPIRTTKPPAKCRRRGGRPYDAHRQNLPIRRLRVELLHRRSRSGRRLERDADARLVARARHRLLIDNLPAALEDRGDVLGRRARDEARHLDDVPRGARTLDRERVAWRSRRADRLLRYGIERGARRGRRDVESRGKGVVRLEEVMRPRRVDVALGRAQRAVLVVA